MSEPDNFGSYIDIDKYEPLWNKIGGIISALVKAAAGVGILTGSDYLVAYIMFRIRLNPGFYSGVYSAASSVVAIIALFIFSRVEGFVFNRKKSDLIRFRKINVAEGWTAVLIALSLLMIVSVYMLVARWISSFQQVVEQAVNRYDQSMEVYVPEVVYPKWDQVLYAVSMFLLVPVAEEFTFRGIIYGAINRRLNGAWAIILSASVFGIMHGLSVHIGYALISGVMIGLAYYAFDSIFVTIIIHGIFNFFGSAIFYFADVLGISHNNLPSMFTVELIATVPAMALLFTAVGKRRNQNRESLKAV